MIALFTRAIADRVREVARWETGEDVKVEIQPTSPRLASALGSSGESATVRWTIHGAAPIAYVVTVTEVRWL